MSARPQGARLSAARSQTQNLADLQFFEAAASVISSIAKLLARVPVRAVPGPCRVPAAEAPRSASTRCSAAAA